MGGASGPGFWSLTNSATHPSFSGFSPQKMSPFLQFSESLLGWLWFLLWLSLSFCRGILVSFSFLCCCSLYIFDTEFPPYNLVLWTDDSVPLFFGKSGSGILVNCCLCGTEATLFFSKGPLCSSFSAEACTILQALRWSRQHQQVCHFSSLLLSGSRSVLTFVFPFTSISLVDLAGFVFSLHLFYQATVGPRTLVSPG